VHFRNERLGVSKNFKDDLNIHYRNILQINTQLKTVLDDEEAESELRDLLKEKLEYAVGRLVSGGKVYGKYRRGILHIIKGKDGLIRGHLSGKRTDYSGRTVIVCDPTLALDEASIPESLWEQVLTGVNKSEKPIALLNRQPSLHRYSFQAFRLSCHQLDNVIRLNPFVCKPFNADFDGDTIAIHVPRTSEAEIEAHKLLPSRNLLSQANGKLVLGFDKDIALAAAYITYHPEINTGEEVPLVDAGEVSINGKDFWEECTVHGIKTTAGRLVLRRIFGDVPISNRCMDKEAWLNNLEKLAKQVFKKEPDIFIQFSNEISALFSDILRESGLSLSFSDFATTIDSEKYSDKYPTFLWLLRQSGKYGKRLETQIVKKWGKMRRPGMDNDQTEPIESCLIKGHSVKDYLISAHGARAGLVDKGLITAHSGHLLRDWIYWFQNIYIVENDCKTSKGMMPDKIEKNQLLKFRFDKNGALIEKIHDDTLFRSPLTCNAKDSENHRGICQKCYGINPATGDLPTIGLPVGILAAQAVGERVSQETLKSFHEGGRKEDQKKGLTLVKYLRDMFPPENKSADSEVEKLIEIYKHFSESSRPSLVHFEVILLGYKLKKFTNSILGDMAKSQAPSNLLKMAVKTSNDNLFTAVSKIVSGRITNTGPK
jgi:DNA-directed RNA polymerase beta' subunit